MYMEEIFSEEIKNETSKLLKLLGVKHAVKKLDHRLRPEKKVELYHVFKTSLELLEKDAVTLAQSSAPVEVPVFIIDTCEFIKKNVKIEGLFRKAGSTSKQRELRATLDCGNRLEQDADHQVINVANILKLFFRELPEPLIPFNLHDLFLRCLTLKENKIEAILLGCLLLPTEHLNTLAYLMQFLNLIAMNSEFNKMDVGNLSIIFTPSIMPVSAPKLTPHGGERINHHVQIIRASILNVFSLLI
ncbi:hypothetical protein AAG570_013292 [Ranatra chinensis]|uniref:Rho-GAP domain-containing protein n=1 Tax=Ranatra chinensis TaxID=642074 RepID=A0ABD0YIC4_9HEMI